jgi:hypothetical protein
MRVQILTLNNVQIFGDMAVSALPDSYRSRLSDRLNSSRNFIVLTDVEIHQPGQPFTQMSSLCINKPAIAFLCEAEVTPTSSQTLETDPVSVSAS